MLIGLLKALLALASSIAGYLREKQLMEAGSAKTMNEAINEALASINRAHDARRNSSSAGVPDNDPNNRD